MWLVTNEAVYTKADLMTQILGFHRLFSLAMYLFKQFTWTGTIQIIWLI